MKHKPYSEITVEIRTQLKTVKITSNIYLQCTKVTNAASNIIQTHCDKTNCRILL